MADGPLRARGETTVNRLQALVFSQWLHVKTADECSEQHLLDLTTFTDVCGAETVFSTRPPPPCNPVILIVISFIVCYMCKKGGV